VTDLNLITLSELARRKGVKPPSMCERVLRLEKLGSLTVHKRGRNRLVNEAEFDLAVDGDGDAVAEVRVEREPIDDRGELRDVQFDRAKYERDMIKLKVDREKARLRPIEDIQAGAIAAAIAVVRGLERLPQQSSELYEIATKRGERALRDQLEKLTREIRQACADELKTLAQTDEDKS